MQHLITTVSRFLIASAVLGAAPIALAMDDFRAESLYTSLAASEMSVSFLDAQSGAPRVGVSVTEKAISGLFCRKFLVVAPHTEPTFACYGAMNYTSDQLKKFFSGIRASAERVDRVDSGSGERPVGAPVILEKSSMNYLCQERLPIVAKPVGEYSCYRDLSTIK